MKAKTSFDHALKFVLVEEGAMHEDGTLTSGRGYVNDPRDPGGETIFGLSRRAFPDLDVKSLQSMPEDEAIEEVGAVYKEHYFDACCGDELPPALALSVFDSAVNQGVKKATQFLQVSIGVSADGFIGPVTIKKANAVDPVKSLKEFTSNRCNHYMRLHNLNLRFGLGWSRRVVNCYEAARELIIIKKKGK